jgi:gamma-glutamylcysteine synthetase
MRNEEVLDAIASEVFQAELGQFNIEVNVRPSSLAGKAAEQLEGELRDSLNEADRRAQAIGAHIVMIGILPTLTPDHLTGAALSTNPRYELINEQIFAARGEDLHIAIDGPERLDMHADTIAPEAACTSVQFHLQVSPQEYAATWNAAQCLAGVQLGLGANSPFLFGKELWRETRIALFEQATDTRPQELKAQGVRPRVWFGERWITSVFDHFEENVSYFPALLPVCDDEDPAAVLARGDVPRLGELRMHNGTIYRWNRPVYDVHRGRPHLRVENRVLPAGPSIVDVFANAAFYYGLLRVLAAQDRPVWSQLSFAAAEDNFRQAARYGINAQVYWPRVGTVPVTELVLRRLLPLAREGLDGWGVDGAVSDRLLGVIERRCLTHRNGAEWQVETFHRIDEQKQPLDRRDSLREMLRRYVENMHSNEPVDSWPLE